MAGRTYGDWHWALRSGGPTGRRTMPASLLPRAPRAVTAGVAGCAMALALAAPGMAGAAGPADLRAGAPTGSLAGTTSSSPVVNAPGTDVAAPDQQNVIPAPTATPVVERPRVVSVERGATTLAIVAIAAAALVAGAGAGFAGGRRGALRTG